VQYIEITLLYTALYRPRRGYVSTRFPPPRRTHLLATFLRIRSSSRNNRVIVQKAYLDASDLHKHFTMGGTVKLRGCYAIIYQKYRSKMLRFVLSEFIMP